MIGVFILILALAALGWLLLEERQDALLMAGRMPGIKSYERKHAFFAKGAASLGFLLLGALSFLRDGLNWSYWGWMMAGLFLGLAGDLLISLDKVWNRGKKPALLLGMSAFLLGHIAYVAAFSQLASFQMFNVVTAFILLVAEILLSGRLKFQFGSFSIPGIVYAASITLMLVKALSVLEQMGYTGQSFCIIAGAVLFFVSDVLIIYILFKGKDTFVYKLTNLLSYYVAQLLLAGSLWIR